MPTVSVAADVQSQRGWVKNAATAAFLFLFLKGTVWVAAAWLAMRGMNP
ncbi:hypothetical protein [Steroidobacter sp.]|nr:hypothetical protein [Steroidobacter sp.]MBL8269318.1 hypothetical protein [Steroidobacter sp.]